MWIVAIGAGISETILVVASGRAGDHATAGVAVRAVVFAVAIVIVLRMFSGRLVHRRKPSPGSAAVDALATAAPRAGTLQANPYT